MGDLIDSAIKKLQEAFDDITGDVKEESEEIVERKQKRSDEAIKILNERLARGEITKTKYRSLRNEIEREPNSK
jgi:uncharacterized membrane protein